MNQQLSLFEVALAPTLATVAKVGAPARQPKAVRYDIEQDEQASECYHVWHGETYLGFIYHIAQKVWSLFFPGQRGICGFGYKNQQTAAAELHRLFIRKEKGLEV